MNAPDPLLRFVNHVLLDFGRLLEQDGPLSDDDAETVRLAVDGLQALLDQGREFLRRPRHQGNHVFKVRLGSAVALVEAPNATAAAVFFGKTCDRGEAIGVSVLEADGAKYRDRTPWLDWQFGLNNPDSRTWEGVQRDLTICRMVESLA